MNHFTREELDAREQAMRNEFNVGIEGVRVDMARQSRELRTDMERQSGEIRADMARQFGDLNARFNALEGKIDRGHADIRAEVKESQNTQLKWIIGLFLAAQTIQIAVLSMFLHQMR